MHRPLVKSVRICRITSVFFSLLFFPSFFYVFLRATSTALGLWLALLVVFLFTARQVRFSYSVLANISFALGLFSFILFLQSLLAIGFGGHEVDSRTIYSALFFISILVSSCFLSLYLLSLDEFCFVRAILIASITSVLLGLISILFEQNFLGYERFHKSVFPFAEPSHYAITMGPILFASGFFLPTKFRVVLLLFSMFFSVATPSLVMILFSGMMTCFFFKWRPATFFFVGLVFLFFFLLVLSSDQESYFADRLSFSSGSRNVTALVYMQGWEDMLIALRSSNWLGIGFQNLGTLSPGYYGELIYTLAGEYKNRTDGGFLASKIVAELGVLGILLISSYLFFWLKSALFLLRVAGGRVCRCSGVVVFANAIVVAFVVELFARGSGYFTPGLFFAFVSFFVLYFSRANVGVK